MRLDVPDLSPHGETLAAVVVGALLATLSGVLANQLETHLRRRERERSAALLFGEVLSTLRLLLQSADGLRQFAPAYGPFTQRMLRAARREIDIYDRNRESLVDLRDPALRADLHRVVVQISMPLDGIIDTFGVLPPDELPSRERGFSFMLEQVTKIPAIVERLGRLARHDFKNFDTVNGRDSAAVTGAP